MVSLFSQEFYEVSSFMKCTSDLAMVVVVVYSKNVDVYAGDTIQTIKAW